MRQKDRGECKEYTLTELIIKYGVFDSLFEREQGVGVLETLSKYLSELFVDSRVDLVSKDRLQVW